MRFGSCWGEPHDLYLLWNGWMWRILQEIVTFSAIGSSKLLTDSRAESIFSMRRINLSKPAYYRWSLNSFSIIRTSMRNATGNTSTSQNPWNISGRRTLHHVRDCRSTLQALDQLQHLQRLIVYQMHTYRRSSLPWLHPFQWPMPQSSWSGCVSKKLLEPKATSKADNFFYLVQWMHLLQHKCTWYCAAAGTYGPLALKAAGWGWWLRYLSAASLLYAEER